MTLPITSFRSCLATSDLLGTSTFPPATWFWPITLVNDFGISCNSSLLLTRLGCILWENEITYSFSFMLFVLILLHHAMTDQCIWNCESLFFFLCQWYLCAIYSFSVVPWDMSTSTVMFIGLVPRVSMHLFVIVKMMVFQCVLSTHGSSPFAMNY